MQLGLELLLLGHPGLWSLVLRRGLDIAEALPAEPSSREEPLQVLLLLNAEGLVVRWLLCRRDGDERPL